MDEQAQEKTRVVVLVGTPVYNRLHAMCTARCQTVPEVLRALINDALEDWAYKQPRIAPDELAKKAGIMGRPIDSDEAKRGKKAYKMVMDTYQTLSRNGNWAPKPEKFEEFFGWQKSCVEQALERQDWNYLVVFDQIQPWNLNKWMPKPGMWSEDLKQRLGVA